MEESEDPLSGITLHSLVGFTSPKTMKLSGTIDGKPVVILVDFGASSNFISTSVAKQIALPLSTCALFGVTLGTRTRVFGDGICKNVKILVQGFEIFDDFFSLELGSLDVILGVQWLEKLGTVMVNWRAQTMCFEWNERELILQGDPSLRYSRISLKATVQWFEQPG